MSQTISLTEKLQELESYFEYKEFINKEISNASVGWQLDHSLKVILVVCKGLQKSDPIKYKWRFNAKRLLCFTFKFFPRGGAKAPKVVRPNEDITLEALKNQLAEAHEILMGFNTIDNNAFITHFIFGDLNRDNSLCLLKIHTEHHLKIIRDILKK